MKFNEILAELLTELEKNPGQSAEEIIKNKARELSLSEQAMSEIEKTNRYIDGIEKVVKEMDEAREEGISRAEFVQNRIIKAMDGLTPEKRELFLNELLQPKEEQIEKLSDQYEAEK